MTQRTNKVGSLIREEIGNILARDFEQPEGTLVSVMRVSVAPDLKRATVFVSVLPDNKTGTALAALKRMTHGVQQQLNKKLFMKSVPKISWDVDLTNIKYAKIDEALNS